MTESNVEIARRGFEAALRGDLDAVGEFLDPDVKWRARTDLSRGDLLMSLDVVMR